MSRFAHLKRTSERTARWGGRRSGVGSRGTFRKWEQVGVRMLLQKDFRRCGRGGDRSVDKEDGRLFGVDELFVKVVVVGRVPGLGGRVLGAQRALLVLLGGRGRRPRFLRYPGGLERMRTTAQNPARQCLVRAGC